MNWFSNLDFFLKGTFHVYIKDLTLSAMWHYSKSLNLWSYRIKGSATLTYVLGIIQHLVVT